MCYKPLHDRDYDAEAREWMDAAAKWHRGEGDDLADAADIAAHPFYWEWHGMPPEKEDYAPNWPEAERTHVQMYETVSEGTPVSPVFASLAELADWMVTQGYSRNAADRFCETGYAPSMVVENFGGEVRMAQNAHMYDLPGIVSTPAGRGDTHLNEEVK